ncbi:MAG: hypothetical protein AABY15_07835 [Nanoarchaeota archaeon]
MDIKILLLLPRCKEIYIAKPKWLLRLGQSKVYSGEVGYKRHAESVNAQF